MLSSGTYEYHFEMLLPLEMPESVDTRQARVHYTIRAYIDSPGYFGCSSSETKHANVVRCLSEDFLDDEESLHA